MKYSLYISPCPNDTFAFYALIHGIVDLEGVEFDVHFDDIERLNSRIISGDGDIIKGSIALKPKAEESGYCLLSSGAALGRGNGPIVVRRASKIAINNGTVALPGKHTTATLLFNRYFKDYKPCYTIFNRVADMVEAGQSELGVLIHEGRFTYMERGLEFVADLGKMWEEESAMPLPLGGIYMREGLDTKRVTRIIRHSVEWALENRTATLEFVKSHASELSEEVMQNHIDYFVNEYTVDLTDSGRSAIDALTCGK